MRHNDVIYLISEEVTYDDIGSPIKEKVERMVYANEFSVGATEFYQASSQGLKPDCRFEVYSFEYENEEEMKHEDVLYKIIRTQKNGEKILLTGERVVGDG